MSLVKYNKKRDFKQTSEPSGKVAKAGKSRFVVQRHDASHLHYDFRLEMDGVLKSWAVPKGPSLNPGQKRLAVMVEDHPVSYINFHGTIPAGNYGAGEVEVWDKGNYLPVDKNHKELTERQALLSLKKGELKFLLNGNKLNGEFVLVRLQNDAKNWLLIKHKDDYAVNRIYNAEDIDKGSSAPETISSIRHGKAKKLSSLVKPMLATATKIPFDNDNWIFEVKWDGYRAVSETGSKEPKFYSRNGIDFSGRFPVIYKALQKIKHKAILDGEIVLLNEKNLPDFQKLQHYETNLDYPLVYYVFDILQLDGKKMEDLQLIDRKKILKKLLGRNKVIRYCDHVEGKGISFLDIAKEQGLEGIIAKRKDSTYTKGYRSKEWLKIKNVQSTEVVIAGFTEPKGGRKHFGSLVLASKKAKGWEYRGHVGTGFDTALLTSLRKMMKPLEMDESPFKSKVPLNGDVTWIKPKLVADIAYTEITRDKIFRHPVFLRLRDDKPTKDVNEEIVEEMKEAKDDNELKVGSYKVAVSNQQKIYWPDEGYTKGDLLKYYDTVSDYILPHLKNRPLSLKRNPNGIRDEGFYHKDAGENAPDM